MPDVMRIVEVDFAGEVTEILDLQNYTGSAGYARERDTFEFTPPQLTSQMTQLGGVWGGQRAVGARAENARLAANFLVRGSSVDDCLARAARIVAMVDEALLYPNRFIEWRSELASTESYYEIRGPGNWRPTYSSVQMTQESMLMVQLDWPAAPYVRGAPISLDGGDQNTPIQLDFPSVGHPDPLPGDLAPQVDMLVDVSTTAANPGWVWAAVGWNSLITTGAPFGPLSISAAFGWTLTSPNGLISGTPFLAYSTGLANGFIGNQALKCAWDIQDGPSEPNTSYASCNFQDYRLDPDTPGDPTTLVEVWALTVTAQTNIRPRIVAALRQSPGAELIGSLEYGTRGKELIVPTDLTGQFHRISLVKLGTLPFPNDPGDVPCELRLYFEWSGATAATNFMIDYLFFLPSRRSAMGRTGVVLDDHYPRFMPANGFRKLVNSDLTALLAAHDTANYGVHHGLGGHPIEPEAFRENGAVSFCVLGATDVPDDPDSSTSHNIDDYDYRANGHIFFQAWPRYRYAVHNLPPISHGLGRPGLAEGASDGGGWDEYTGGVGVVTNEWTSEAARFGGSEPGVRATRVSATNNGGVTMTTAPVQALINGNVVEWAADVKAPVGKTITCFVDHIGGVGGYESFSTQYIATGDWQRVRTSGLIGADKAGGNCYVWIQNAAPGDTFDMDRWWLGMAGGDPG